MLADLGRGSRNDDACVLHGFDLAGCVSLSFLDDSASVAHSSLWRGSQTSNESNNWLVMDVVFLQPIAGHLLSLPSDFSDHDDTLGFWVDYEFLEDIDEVGAVEGISSDTDNSGLSESSLGGLIDCLIGEGA